MTKKDKIAEAKNLFQKGLDYWQEDRFDEAIECLHKAVELDPEYLDAWYNLGNTYYTGKGDFDSAYKYWQKALELNPDEIDVLYNLCNAHREREEFDKSIECTQKALEFYPESDNLHSLLNAAKRGKEAQK